MTTKYGIVHNENGIHCRPASLIAKKAREYSGAISIVNGSGLEANPRSVLSILKLGLIEGDEFSVSVNGPDEEKMCDEMLELLEQPFSISMD